jgi:DNA-binding MarR family transcriptional regulator
MYDYDIPDARVSAWMLLFQAFYAMRKAEDRKLAKTKLGLSHEKVTVLQLTKLYDIPLTPAELSRSLFREGQTIAGLLTRMEKEGLVTRDKKRKGKPYTEVKATAKGEELYRPGVRTIVSFVTDIMSCLSAEELEQLQKLLRKIRQRAIDELRMELLPGTPSIDRWLADMGR